MKISARGGRRGSTLVQTALVISIAFVLIFSVYEYGRFVMMKQLMENAAREGARFAVAHTNDMTEADIRNEIRKFLVGFDAQLENFQITISGVVLRDGGTNGAKGTALPAWTDASLTDGVVVQVDGDYKPYLPTLLWAANGLAGTGAPPGTDGVFLVQIRTDRIGLRAKSVMYSEGN